MRNSNVRKGLRRLLLAGAGVSAVAALAGGGAFFALRHVPSFYHRALAADPEQQAEASDQMLREAAELSSLARRQSVWEAHFSQEEINGWLAIDLVKNHARSLPANFAAPRTAITAGEATIACQYRLESWGTILSVSFDCYMSEPNVLALRLKRARAGALPLPLGRILEAVSHVVRELEMPVEWRQNDGDPVALVHLPPIRAGKERWIEIDGLEIADGEIVLRGRSRPTEPQEKTEGSVLLKKEVWMRLVHYDPATKPKRQMLAAASPTSSKPTRSSDKRPRSRSPARSSVQWPGASRTTQ
ncbi:MAG: hypothetical protein U0836_21545 [Pirellulales bacterium]